MGNQRPAAGHSRGGAEEVAPEVVVAREDLTLHPLDAHVVATAADLPHIMAKHTGKAINFVVLDPGAPLDAGDCIARAPHARAMAPVACACNLRVE